MAIRITYPPKKHLYILPFKLQQLAHEKLATVKRCDVVCLIFEAKDPFSVLLLLVLAGFAAKCIPLGAPLPTEHPRNFNSF